MTTPRSAPRRGIISGILAATALALWFLGIDLAQGEPFRTPAFLARVLFGFEDGALSAGAIALYTVIHYAVFIGIGIATALVVERLNVVPGALVGIVVGFLLFDLLFYGSVLLTGVDVVNVLGWPGVLLGNVLAGIVLLASLSALGGVRPLDWRRTLAEHRTLREGLAAGMVGAVLVAAWFLVIDLAAGRPFFTPAALGSALLGGAAGVTAVQVTTATVLGYTAVHLAAFLMTGLVAAAFVQAAEDGSEALLLGGVLLFFTFEVFSIGLLAIVARWLVDTLSWWTIIVANLIAAAGMGAYLAWRHPRLIRDLGSHELEEELAHEGEPAIRQPPAPATNGPPATHAH